MRKTDRLFGWDKNQKWSRRQKKSQSALGEGLLPIYSECSREEGVCPRQTSHLLSFRTVFFYVSHKRSHQRKIDSKALCWKHKCIFTVSLIWLCPASHETEISLLCRLCHWRRFPAKPAHPQAPFLPETIQPISYPGAETWGWTKHVFLNLKAWVCISSKILANGVLQLPFFLVYPPTVTVCCYFSDGFKEVVVNWNLAVVTWTSQGQRKGPAVFLLVTYLIKYRSKNGSVFLQPELSAINANWVFVLH